MLLAAGATSVPTQWLAVSRTIARHLLVPGYAVTVSTAAAAVGCAVETALTLLHIALAVPTALPAVGRAYGAMLSMLLVAGPITATQTAIRGAHRAVFPEPGLTLTVTTAETAVKTTRIAILVTLAGSVPALGRALPATAATAVVAAQLALTIGCASALRRVTEPARPSGARCSIRKARVHAKTVGTATVLRTWIEIVAVAVHGTANASSFGRMDATSLGITRILGARIQVAAHERHVSASPGHRLTKVRGTDVAIVARRLGSNLVTVADALRLGPYVAQAGERRTEVQRAGVAVIAQHQYRLALPLDATVVGAGVVIVAVSVSTGHTRTHNAPISKRTLVSVATCNIQGRMIASRFGVAGILRAGIAVIAASLIDLAAAIVIHAVAAFLRQMRDQRVSGRAIRGIEIPVPIVVQVAWVALAVSVQILLPFIEHMGTVVIFVRHFVTVLIRSTVDGTGSFGFTHISLAQTVATTGPAVRRTTRSLLRVATDSVTAPAAVHGTIAGRLPPLADTVAAGRDAIPGTLLLRLIRTTDSVPADGAVCGTVVWILPVLAKAVTTRRHAVGRADQHVLSHCAKAVTAGRRTVPRATLRSLLETAEAVTAPPAIHDAHRGILPALAQAVPARRHAIRRAGTSGHTVFVNAADSISAPAAVHRTAFGRFAEHTIAVAAGRHTLRRILTGTANSTGTVVIRRAVITVIARLTVIARQVPALTIGAKVQGAGVSVFLTG